MNSGNKQPLIFVALLTLFSAFAERSFSQEEFHGPYQSWANMKSRFNARGDGKTDDTRALQRAIDSLTCSPVAFNTGATGYTVIYLPAGIYRISKTLIMRGKIGVQIIGEDPEKTKIIWTGPAKDTMFWSNASAYFKISRITWDANNVDSVVCIGLHWKERWSIRKTDSTPGSRSFASVYNEFSDLVFTGKPLIGISGGTLHKGVSPGTGANDSETTIRRCTFDQCQLAGIKITGFNALEYWIWDSKFLNCNVGVHCTSGNYHLYRSYFRQSAVADISNSQGYYTSARYCYSENSKAFSIDAGASSNPFKRTFQANTIINTEQIPIQYTHVGRITLFDNEITNTRDPNNTVMVSQRSWAPASYQMLSVGNRYGNNKAPLKIANKSQKIYTVGDQELKKSEKRSIGSFTDNMPETPPEISRKIFEVPAGADDVVVQEIINRAAKLSGERPVVHFPRGDYIFNRTVEIPAGADMQLIGDGLRYATVIKFGKPEKFSGLSLFHVSGPSYITIRDIQIGTFVKFKWRAILFDGIDSENAFVKMDQMYSIADTFLYVTGFNYTRFEKNNSFNADGNVIRGGKIQRSGKGTLQVNAFGGQYASTEVTNNAKFVAKDCWWEGRKNVPLYFKGDGEITIDGAKIAPHRVDSAAIINIERFNGKITLMNMYVQGGINISRDNPELKFFFWNAHMFYKKDILASIPAGFNGRLAFLGLTGQCMYKNDPACQRIWSVENRLMRVEDESAFIEEMTRADRDAIPKKFVQRDSGPSSIYLSRVLFDSFEIALQFNP